MGRESIPKKTRESVLDEYDHRCAKCGGDRPHLHHIDEDPSNNDEQNLLPLCPNCHLRDQHNPTRRIEIPKLILFRRYKDPAILSPQFHPIYLRMKFLGEVAPGTEKVRGLEKSTEELAEFLSELSMGQFYSGKIRKILGKPLSIGLFNVVEASDEDIRKHVNEQNKEYRARIIKNRDEAVSLIIEQLRYQSWANA